jgi:hypothetical protein
MSRSTRRLNKAWICGAVAIVGSVCLSIPSCQGVLSTFNPGGTVFSSITNYQLDALLGDVPDFSLDPTCTIPFYGVDNTSSAGTCATTPTYPSGTSPRPDGQ